MQTKPETIKTQLEQMLGRKLQKRVDKMTYDDWLEYFRRIPAGLTMNAKDWLNMHIPSEGFAAASRWIEIIGKPTRMDKLYQGRLTAENKQSIMDLAVGDDDEAFYEALIRENVAKLDESRNSAQEVARITQNLNIFRQQLRDIRSRKPKKGTVLQKVLELSTEPAKAPKTAKKPAKKATKKKGDKNAKAIQQPDKKAAKAESR